MLWLYRLLFLPALLVLAPRYLLRMRRRGGYREKFTQRFGAPPSLPPKTARPRVWLQAVSVGEILAIGPILEALARDGVEIYLTTTTSTGWRLAADRYRASVADLGYFPLDAWPFSARAWRHIRPDFVILAEGERWPEHLHQAARRGVPVVCVNARVSDRSFARLRRLHPVARLMLDGITRFHAASALDASRLEALGVSRERLLVTGNLKLDVDIRRLAEAERAALRRELGFPDQGPVILGASTWPGEEEALLSAWQRHRSAHPGCSLLLVPRHAERREEIARTLEGAGVRSHFRSRGPADAGVDVTVADTTGELRQLMQLADLVFVGKSLPPHTEGQTPVEAAALGKPILHGPGMSNFRAIVAELTAGGATCPVRDAAELAEAIGRLLRDSTARQGLGTAAAAWHQRNAGATARVLADLRSLLGRAR
ncbi:MAG: 3-deoxy-D-manno-octulosonic acid transferase [Verrucomicrobia bacterium]|nr:3-deoxy-D-manno-octulosonic acid transferase [Verrucomicrobiota bacterium]